MQSMGQERGGGAGGRGAVLGTGPGRGRACPSGEGRLTGSGERVCERRTARCLTRGPAPPPPAPLLPACLPPRLHRLWGGVPRAVPRQRGGGQGHPGGVCGVGWGWGGVCGGGWVGGRVQAGVVWCGDYRLTQGRVQGRAQVLLRLSRPPTLPTATCRPSLAGRCLPAPAPCVPHTHPTPPHSSPHSPRPLHAPAVGGDCGRPGRRRGRRRRPRQPAGAHEQRGAGEQAPARRHRAGGQRGHGRVRGRGREAGRLGEGRTEGGRGGRGPGAVRTSLTRRYTRRWPDPQTGGREAGGQARRAVTK